MGLREDFLDIFNRDQDAPARKKAEPINTRDTRFRAGFGRIYEILTGNDNKPAKRQSNPPDPNGGVK